MAATNVYEGIKTVTLTATDGGADVAALTSVESISVTPQQTELAAGYDNDAEETFHKYGPKKCRITIVFGDINECDKLANRGGTLFFTHEAEQGADAARKITRAAFEQGGDTERWNTLSTFTLNGTGGANTAV